MFGPTYTLNWRQVVGSSTMPSWEQFELFDLQRVPFDDFSILDTFQSYTAGPWHSPRSRMRLQS